MHFLISDGFRVVAATVQRNVDIEDQISHWFAFLLYAALPGIATFQIIRRSRARFFSFAGLKRLT